VPQTPIHKFHVFNRRNTPTSGSSLLPLSAFSSKEPRRMRNIEDLYDVTQVMKDTTLFYFFVDSDLLSFNEVVT